MMTFIPFKPEHLAALELQAAQRYLRPRLADAEFRAALTAGGLAMTGVDTSAARIVGCAGILPLWPGRAGAWAILGRIAPRQWIAVTRKTRSMLDQAHGHGHLRIEATCDSSFAAGLRWLAMLGFEAEGRLRYYAGGRDHIGFARLAAELTIERAA